MVASENLKIIITRINRKMPLQLMLYFLIFIYIIQYPVSLLITGEPEFRFKVTTPLLIEAYLFVIYSVFILISFFYLGTKNGKKKVSLLAIKKIKGIQRYTFLIFFVCYLWSFLMLKMKIGMTIYTDFESLPFK